MAPLHCKFWGYRIVLGGLRLTTWKACCYTGKQVKLYWGHKKKSHGQCWWWFSSLSILYLLLYFRLAPSAIFQPVQSTLTNIHGNRIAGLQGSAIEGNCRRSWEMWKGLIHRNSFCGFSCARCTQWFAVLDIHWRQQYLELQLRLIQCHVTSLLCCLRLWCMWSYMYICLCVCVHVHVIMVCIINDSNKTESLPVSVVIVSLWNSCILGNGLMVLNSSKQLFASEET